MLSHGTVVQTVNLDSLIDSLKTDVQPPRPKHLCSLFYFSILSTQNVNPDPGINFIKVKVMSHEFMTFWISLFGTSTVLFEIEKTE